MSGLDAIWAEMKKEDSNDRQEAKKRSRALGAGGMVGVTKLMKERNIEGYAAGSRKAAAKAPGPRSGLPSAQGVPAAVRVPPAPPSDDLSAQPVLAPSEVLQCVCREAAISETGSAMVRRKSLQNILSTLQSAEETLSGLEYSELFMEISKPLFKRFADDVEKCRELGFRITGLLFERSSSVLPLLAYFLPALMQRIPPSGAYDDELKIFITDIDAHEAFKRGRAVDRQDKGDALRTHIIVETSEEIRLLALNCVASLVRKVASSDACSVLQPYFTEVIVFLQAQLRDPYGDVRSVACEVLGVLAAQPEFELGMKFYAVALVRSLLPVMRHRHAKVRCAAVDAIKACVMVPDRAKRKGAGTAAIQDLVGFHEENVLSVAAFYKSEVQINYMAEIVNDATAVVRERVAIMLSAFLTELEDRYDHQTRLLPYLLDLLTDDVEAVSGVALACLQTCGRQYEEEHQDEIIERRQYGVDGDCRMNLDKPLPPPFSGRPRLGIRLFVRGNTKRFLNALLNELTNWISKTRLKSCKLLKVIVCLVEEHLAMESHAVLPMFVKAIGFATADKDLELKALLLETVELLGRFMSPDIYIHFILPRLMGDVEVVQFGVDASTRISVLEMLQQLVIGTKPSQLPQHIPALVAALVDPFVIDPDSISVRSAGLNLVLVLLQAVAGGSNAAATVSAVEAHFMTTGRLSSLQKTIRSIFCRLVVDLTDPSFTERASQALILLASLEGGKFSSENEFLKLQYLFSQHAAPVVRALIADSFEKFSDSSLPNWSSSDKNTILLMCRLLECPWHCIQADPTTFASVCRHLCSAVWGATVVRGSGSGASCSDNEVLSLLINAAIVTIRPVAAISLLCGESLGAPKAYRHLAGASFTIPKERLRESFELCSIPKAENCIYTNDSSEDSGTLSSLLLESFVINSSWAPSIPLSSVADAVSDKVYDLQRRRLIFATLMLGITENSNIEFGDTHTKLVELPQSFISEISISFLETNRNQFIFHDSSLLMQTVIARALCPSCPLDIRQRGLQLADRIINGILKAGELHKVIPFARRLFTTIELTTVNPTIRDIHILLNASTDQASLISQKCPLKVLFPGPIFIPILLSGLDDSSDKIRCSIIDSICNAVHFLLPDDKVAGESSAAGFSAVTTLLLSHATRVMTKKMKHSDISDNDNEFSDLMGLLLRRIACLDPSLFEIIVRDQLAKLDEVDTISVTHEQRDAISCFFSELISHCDLINLLDPTLTTAKS